MTAWLNSAGRFPLLSAAQEINLGRQIQAWRNHPDGPDGCPAPIRRRGLRARDRLVSCNLRLCAAVERTGARGGEQVDRLQSAALSLVRAAEKFDPERGYKFSTYAFWWIRKGVDRLAEKLPAASGVYLPPSFSDTEDAAVFHRPALRVDGYVRDDGSGDGGRLADLIADERPAPDVLAIAALEAMREADGDALALLELQQIDGFRQAEMAELEGTSCNGISERLCNARRRFRRLPEVAAALA